MRSTESVQESSQNESSGHAIISSMSAFHKVEVLYCFNNTLSPYFLSLLFVLVFSRRTHTDLTLDSIQTHIHMYVHMCIHTYTHIQALQYVRTYVPF